jgi:opacity protein-like surface antigen
MKKIGIVVLIATLTATAAFGLPDFKLSAGAGGLMGLGLGSYEAGDDDIGIFEISNPNFVGGGFIFFDATYAEVSFGFSGGSGKVQVSSGGNVVNETPLSLSQLNMGLLLKYPFGNADKFLIFPLLGIDYVAMLSVKDKDGKTIDDSPGNAKSSDWSYLGICLGVGADFSLTEQLYLRLDVLFGTRLPSKYENDMKEALPKAVETFAVPYLPIKLAVGYRF